VHDLGLTGIFLICCGASDIVRAVPHFERADSGEGSPFFFVFVFIFIFEPTLFFGDPFGSVPSEQLVVVRRFHVVGSFPSWSC
jgi:hypothetical protein